VTDIDDIVDRTLRLAENDYDLRKHYNFQNVTFHRTKGEALPRVRVIVNQIEQVILNLLKNGAYAMKELDEAKRFFVIETWANSGMVHLRIADNGPGVDENIRRRVFEPFFTTKPIGEGIGLGLAVSYMIIVNNHNGLISCEPAEHQSGAAFMLSLPIVDEAS
jgi:C4-dicarboxylate-specific signal transduction histidine kinase